MGEEIALRSNPTIKYGFILRSDLPEFAYWAEPRMPSHGLLQTPFGRLDPAQLSGSDD